MILCIKGEDSLCTMTYFKNEHEILSVGNERICQTLIVYLLSLAMLLASFTKGIFLVFSVSPCSCQDSYSG